MQLVVARELAKGRDARTVRRQFGITTGAWATWFKDPAFLDQVQRKVERFDALVEETLAEGEIEAASTLVQALAATSPIKRKDGSILQFPNWDVRVRAAVSLLDRRGERGKPVERQLGATLNIKSGDIAKQLAGALADPAVQQFLQHDPALAKQLQRELAQLAPPEEAPCIVESSDSSPSS